MIFDENIVKKEDRLVFSKELDEYLERRKNISEKENNSEKESEEKVKLKIYDEEKPKERFNILNVFSFLSFRKNQSEVLLEKRNIKEEINDEDSSEIESYNEDLEELNEQKFSFFRNLKNFIRSIFIKEEIAEIDEEPYEEKEKETITAEELEQDLKTTFRFVKAVLITLPKRYISKIKELPEFKEYKKVVERYNERHKNKEK